MRIQIPTIIRFSALLLLFEFSELHDALAQCDYFRVEHTDQTQTVGCSDVTVTSTGAVGATYDPFCGAGPFRMGLWTNGSYTFNFSPPVLGVRINVSALENMPGASEEMIVHINGSFYPIVNPGIPNGCEPPAMISPGGTIIANPIDIEGAWENIDINVSISSLTMECNLLAGGAGGFVASLFICCGSCGPTDAGQITSPPLTRCQNQPAIVPPAGQVVLDANDMLQYILFSDLSDTTGSIVVTSNTPGFTFDPQTMSAGTTYYIAAMAGNDVGGNVDLNDPCLSISDPIPVVWHPLPSVEFFANDNCISPGNCIAVSVNLTGSPPFQLSGQVRAGTDVLSTFSETYSTNAGLLNFCLPSYTPLGAVVVEAVGLTDAHCNCN